VGDLPGHEFHGNQYALVKSGGGDAYTFSSRSSARTANEYHIHDREGKRVGHVWSHDDPDFKGHVKVWSVSKHGEVRKFPFFKDARAWALREERAASWAPARDLTPTRG